MNKHEKILKGIKEYLRIAIERHEAAVVRNPAIYSTPTFVESYYQCKRTLRVIKGLEAVWESSDGDQNE